MTTLMAFDRQRPKVNMTTISEEDLDLVLAALPAIPSVSPPKLKEVGMYGKEWFNVPEFRDIVPLCARLVKVEIFMSHLEVTSPSVRLLGLHNDVDDLLLDPLARCLRAGRVTGLALNAFNSAASADAIAAMLATVTPLHHSKAVQFYTRLLRGNIHDLIALLDVSNLTHLDAGGLDDFNCLLPFLSQMPLLEELALRDDNITVAPGALMATPLPSLKVLTVSMDAEPFLLWASKLPNLDKVHWRDMDHIPAASLGLFQHVIGLWTHRLSVVSLRSCDFHVYRYETLGLLLS
ncbi:hypothetical protein SPRG_09438 [Saprolegnia parasitica CBS 223.65]|uniref:F-box domain-containing protein n=1 Tax=Saprolegnia parasitica (strain CBS 223.65) TaxID=695850 RepID=A0A067C323_SAPPC|nr:hypothetical protein SPRG_09438 [Saprolegnia parasitica CBS 223.65]KDO25164.1 hypothetical protein SPRG_09438 [Saprolegnia parasitica CBS 223.65]|eukprot:XP_012204032.1 hypothetical protein SPRG_09438 [Saprolegnia parasitica CBS 223.65]